MSRALRVNRRSFLKYVGAAGVVAPWVVRNAVSAPPSNRVRHASFGANGMAGADWVALNGIHNLQLVCVAEVDAGRLDLLKKNGLEGRVKVYQDWREMLDKEHKGLDSVNIGTPDHMHAPMAMSAMQLGLHTYLQKPLAHDLYEVRRLTETAREKKLVTQMGIQIHSASQYRLGVEVIHGGAIGKVKEVHTWSSKKWGDTSALPTKSDPVPSTLNWDQWLGVCAERPYLAGAYYHPANLRKRLDFGTGTFGDMGCHIFDPVFEALGLTAPNSVRSEGPAPNQWNWAINSVIRYVFPGTKYTDGPTVEVHWYDGDQRPSKEVQAMLGGQKLPDQGSIFLGTKGIMVLPHIAAPVLLPQAEFKEYKLPRIAGSSHYKQFVDAILGTGKTTAPFDYSGPLTESVLLGGVATRFPGVTLEWDAAKLTFNNMPEASRFVRRDYRADWHVKGLS
jgi:predicted dehydrogenase